jgi:predicted glycoside hydrolase/deacetylase ChbG (UPF0249 family)
MDQQTVAREVRAQLDTFRQIVARDPTHLDSHQHVHRDEPVRSVLLGLAREIQIPLRSSSPEVKYNGCFYGQTATGDPAREAIEVEALMHVLRNLPAGVTELGCHPGFTPDLDTMYQNERELELHTLCDPRVTKCIADEKITLCSFADVSLHGFG